MSRQSIQKAYDCMTPSPAAKARMLNNILAKADRRKVSRYGLDASLKRLALMAAVNALVIGLSITAYTAGWLGGRQSVTALRGTEIVTAPAQSTTAPAEMEESLDLSWVSLGQREYDAGYGQIVTGEFICMQGFKGSPEYEAAKEWQDFVDSYDPDGSIRRAYGVTSDGMANSIGSTPAMETKMVEILEKYGLTYLDGLEFYPIDKEFFSAAGTGAFFERRGNGYENNIGTPGVYSDSTFMFDADAKFTSKDAPWMYTIRYQFRRSMKGSFSSVYLNIKSADDYDVWSYTTKNGVKLTLAQSNDKSLVIADLEKSFVVINIISPSSMGDIVLGEQHMGHETLEAFAELFDFTQIP